MYVGTSFWSVEPATVWCGEPGSWCAVERWGKEQIVRYHGTYQACVDYLESELGLRYG